MNSVPYPEVSDLPTNLQNKYRIFTIFEGSTLKVGKKYGSTLFSSKEFTALSNYYGTKGTEYFSLINEGVVFRGWVGFFQLENFGIEILPKFHSNFENSRLLLWEILRFNSGILAILNSSKKYNRIQYFPELIYYQFLDEVRKILRKGLIKKYGIKTGNNNSYRGRINFSRNIQNNFIHQERIFSSYTSYDIENTYNKIIYSTLKYINKYRNNSIINSIVDSLIYLFPKMPYLKIDRSTFNSLTYDRKSDDYKNIILLAREIYHQSGTSNTSENEQSFVFMYPLDIIWDRYIYNNLKKISIENHNIQIVEEQKIISFINYSKHINIRHIYIRSKQKKYLVLTSTNAVDQLFESEKIFEFSLKLKFSGADEIVIFINSQSDLKKEGNFHLSEGKQRVIKYRIYGIPISSAIEFSQNLIKILHILSEKN